LEDVNVPLPDIELKTDNFLRDIVITTEEIVDIIKIINPNKTSGPEIISHKMLKICPEKIVKKTNCLLIRSVVDLAGNQSNKLLSTPYDLILCINLLCQTLSNALEKSQNTKQLISFFSSEFRMQLYICNSWCTVEYFGRKPD
jgi:hypothetical protein